MSALETYNCTGPVILVKNILIISLADILYNLNKIDQVRDRWTFCLFCE